jgi:pyruvoyl-dependent arginine decarboxylase (PvlArgDC)
MSARPGTSEVRIGAYALEVRAQSGSFAEYEATSEKQDARALAEALAETPEESPFVESVEQLEASGKAATNGVERAHELSRAVSTGGLLDRGMLLGEIEPSTAGRGRGL